jgi:methanogenic corrinoid protein MtbC1
LRTIAARYSGQGSHTYYLAGLVMAGEIFREVTELLAPLTQQRFTVHDLGVDVPAGDFLAAATVHRPGIIGLSGLLTSSYDAMRDTIRLIRTVGDPTVASLPIIAGGNQINQQVCDYIGADAWVNDAMAGVRLCQRLLAQ